MRTPRSAHIPEYLTHPQQKDVQTRSRDERGKTDVVERFLIRRRYTNAVTERRRKSRPRLPVDDDEEIDGAQVVEEPLAGSRVRTVLMTVDTGTTRRRSAVVSSASRRSSIEDDESQ